MKKFLAVSVVIVFLGMTGFVQAAFIDAPVPDNAYITLNGYDWAWASPCSGPNCGSGINLDLSYQSQFGWHIPDLDELALAPLATDFVFEGANVPYNGVDPVSGASNAAGDPLGDLAVAVPYFNSVYHHADFANAPGSGGDPDLIGPWNTPGAILGGDYAEFLVVRGVPEPATILLLGSGLIALAGLRRKFKK